MLSSFTECLRRRVRGETTAELELRSTINICRQWAAHISARGRLPLAWTVLLRRLPGVLFLSSPAAAPYLYYSGVDEAAACMWESVSMYLRIRAHDLGVAAPLPPFSVPRVSTSVARGHVCVTARLLPNVRCKFPLSRLTRSAPTFRRVPG